MARGRFSHQTTAATPIKSRMPTTTGQVRAGDSVFALRSMRKSSSVGLCGLTAIVHLEETAFRAPGQGWQRSGVDAPRARKQGAAQKYCRRRREESLINPVRAQFVV